MGKGKNGGNKHGSEGSSKEVVVAVLKVNIHCEGCAKKLYNCLKGYDGVEEIVIENANQKVIVKGKNLVPMKVLGRLHKKYSRTVELISPKPKTEDSEKKEDQKKEEPKVKTLALKMHMHCEKCAVDIKRNILRMEGIMSVEPDMQKSVVVIRGLFDAPKLVEKITKRLGKKVEILKKEGEEKGKGSNQDERRGNEIVGYQYDIKHIYYPSTILSDDNVFSCPIM